MQLELHITGQSVTHGSGPSSSPTISTSNNRITALGGSNYYYDSNGSLTQDDLFKYKYDAENRVVEIRNLSDTLLTSYAYDGHGMQVIKVAGGTRTWFLYAGSQLVSEYYDAASNNYTSPTSPGGAPADTASTLLYQHSDHLTTRVTTDNAGTLSNQQAHYPYGENWYATGTADPSVPRKFTSYRKEGGSLATGQIHYAKARYNGARVGRFHRPTRRDRRLPQNLNGYPSGSSDPINRPSGDAPPQIEDADVPTPPDPTTPFMGWDSFWQWKWMQIAATGWYPGQYMHDPNEWPPIQSDFGGPGYSPWMSLIDQFLGHFFPDLFQSGEDCKFTQDDVRIEWSSSVPCDGTNVATSRITILRVPEGTEGVDALFHASPGVTVTQQVFDDVKKEGEAKYRAVRRGFVSHTIQWRVAIFCKGAPRGFTVERSVTCSTPT